MDYSSSAPFHYVKKIVLERFGCPELVLESDPRGVTLSAVGSSAGIFFPPFLDNASTAELLSRPDAKLNMLPADDFVKETIEEHAIPALFRGDVPAPRQFVSFGENEVRVHFDLLGTVFYILSRVEECRSLVRDSHGRFPASASHAFKNEYLHRPVVDELTEILWNCIKYLWPGLERKKKEFTISLSHDVDIPFAEAFSGPGRVLRYFAGDVIKRKEIPRAFKRIRNIVLVRRGNFKKDTNYTFDDIMHISEKHGLKSAFYFKTDCTNGKFDIPYPIEHPFLRELLRDIHNRGHEIGLHPSYETYRNPEQTRKEFEKLLQVCSEEGITQDKWGGRQHYLRWEAPTTWRNWNEAGLNYDSSLSYADCAGFRCGTCHDFPVFDVFQNSTLKLLERPLIVMEGTLFGENYMNLSYKKAIETTLVLKRHCRKFRGNFTLLWHNSSFQTKSMWEYYKTVLED